MKIKKFLYLLVLTTFLFLFSNLNVDAAGKASLSLTGSNKVYINNKIEITLWVSNLKDVDGGISAIGSKLVYDSSYLDFISSSSLAPYTIQYMNQSKKIGGLSMGNNITKNTGLIKLVFKAKKIGKTTVKLSGAELSDGKGGLVSTSNPSKSISIEPTPSSNNNLASITLSNGTLSFNKNNTSYNVFVDSSVTSININAKTEDATAKVRGTGTKNLNYGDNKATLTVTAASGAMKTYTININRKDNRSSNNTLKSLSVDGYSLTPNFNSSTTSYSIKVPYNVSAVNVRAMASDSNAKVRISGNNNLVAERTTNVTITVTAENGSVKTYIIRVRREKDPNKVLATDNNLASLTVDKGKITPDFNRNTTEYKVIVPNDVEDIKISASPSDKNYGEVDITGPEKLNVGDNKYQIKVMAEDESIKIYTVTVTREKNPDDLTDEPVIEPTITKPSLDLKSIIITNGTIKEKFNKDLHLYHYKKSDDIKVEALAADENNKVTILENDNIYNIIIENNEGDTAIYTLIPATNNLVLVITIITSFIFIGIITGYKIGINKNFELKKNLKKRKAKSKKVEQ